MKKALITVVTLAVPRAALACPVCFWQSDAPMAYATNMGILMMLGVVAAMLSGFAAFFVHLSRRARLVDDSTRPAAQQAPAAGDATHYFGKDPQEGTAQC
jgi:hypothetical protein